MTVLVGVRRDCVSRPVLLFLVTVRVSVCAAAGKVCAHISLFVSVSVAVVPVRRDCVLAHS